MCKHGYESMTDIKLFVCCHQQVNVPNIPLLFPMQVGAAVSDSRFSNFLHDDNGDNISVKNPSYCELTAQYWAWKNAEAEYYGFFHYRRYLYPNKNVKSPYQIERELTSKKLNELGYGAFEELIKEYDIIASIGENMYVSVREHYKNAPFHHIKDLKLAECILLKHYPEMTEALETYMSGTVCYFGNIYIMRRNIFQDYCAWLFPILEEFDRQTDMSGYSPQERRVDGYLAERLFGVYLTFRRSELKVLELPRVLFYEGKEYPKHKLLNAVLPPGSKRRSFIKRHKANRD